MDILSKKMVKTQESREDTEDKRKSLVDLYQMYKALGS